MKPETALQSRIISALRDLGVWVERVNSGQASAKGYRVHLLPKGTPDLLLVGPAPLCGAWLEVKLPGEQLGPDQVAWHERARGHGVRAAVVESVQEAARVVAAWRRA